MSKGSFFTETYKELLEVTMLKIKGEAQKKEKLMKRGRKKNFKKRSSPRRLPHQKKSSRVYNGYSLSSFAIYMVDHKAHLRQDIRNV